MRKPDLRSSSSSMGEEEERRELSEGFREGELLSPCSTDRELGRSSSDWGKRRTEEEVEKKKCYRAERVFTECDLIFLTACFCYFTGIKAIQPQRKLYYLYFSMRLYCIVQYVGWCWGCWPECNALLLKQWTAGIVNHSPVRWIVDHDAILCQQHQKSVCACTWIYQTCSLCKRLVYEFCL